MKKGIDEGCGTQDPLLTAKLLDIEAMEADASVSSKGSNRPTRRWASTNDQRHPRLPQRHRRDHCDLIDGSCGDRMWDQRASRSPDPSVYWAKRHLLGACTRHHTRGVIVLSVVKIGFALLRKRLGGTESGKEWREVGRSLEATPVFLLVYDGS